MRRKGILEPIGGHGRMEAKRHEEEKERGRQWSGRHRHGRLEPPERDSGGNQVGRIDPRTGRAVGLAVQA